MVLGTALTQLPGVQHTGMIAVGTGNAPRRVLMAVPGDTTVYQNLGRPTL